MNKYLFKLKYNHLDGIFLFASGIAFGKEAYVMTLALMIMGAGVSVIARKYYEL